MIDRALRPVKARLLRPLSAAVAARFGARAAAPLTAVGLLVGLAAALAAALGAFGAALALWLLNRVLDGLDGEVARSSGAADDRGGYLDLMADRIVYAALPLGAAAGASGALGGPALLESPWTWPLTAALLASFYVNIGTVDVIAALLEKRGQGAAAVGDPTSLRLPAGLVEGFETIVLMSLLLAAPRQLPLWLALFASLTALSALQRGLWGARLLARPAAERS